jgi:hypothetical protein
MKRKSHPKPEPVIPEQILELAKLSVSEDRVKPPVKCVVCGSPTAPPVTDEPLCWVCRRLKISAWREVEQQAPIQE